MLGIFRCTTNTRLQTCHSQQGQPAASLLLVLVGEKLMHEWENKRKGENNGQGSVRVCESCYSSHPVLAVLACDCRVQQTTGCSAAVLHAAQAVKKQ